MPGLYESAAGYACSNPGFGSTAAVLTAQKMQEQIRHVLTQAAQTELPMAFHYGGGFIHQIVAELSKPNISPASAQLLMAAIQTADYQPLIKNLEFALAAIAQRSPETWEHLKHHTALTMMTFAPLHGDIKQQPYHALRALTAALGHDIGKLAIDVELLHKNTRLEPSRFEHAVAHYIQHVPNYPLKAHDLEFLSQADMGNIVFSQQDNEIGEGRWDQVDLSKSHRNERHWLSPDELAKHSRILVRIHQLARQYIPDAEKGNWLGNEEIRQLASISHGTLNKHEQAVLATHDPMGSLFFALQQLPKEMALLPQIVNMQTEPTDPLAKDLNKTVKITDTFEALTADRSYRKGYSVCDALVTMQNMAEKHSLDRERFGEFLQSGVWHDYARAYGKELGDLHQLMPLLAEKSTDNQNFSHKIVSAKDAAHQAAVVGRQQISL